MAFTPEQEKVLALMADERLASMETQAVSLIDQKQTAEGQLRGLQQYLSTETAAAVETALNPALTDTVLLKG